MEQLFPGRSVVVLDGGTGTTLEDELGADISSSLWSSELLKTEAGRKTLGALVRKWEEAGAQIVETCTYQASQAGIEATLSGKESDRPAEALDILRSAVSVTHDALRRSGETKVALSLGPYGATLRPGREYTGRYDPPYGPGPSASNASTSTPSSSTFEQALFDFHLDRFLAFAADEPTWRKVDLVVCETIPSLVEAKTIRRAYARLVQRLQELYAAGYEADVGPAWWRKPLVMSFVFPDEAPDGEGAFPTPWHGSPPTTEVVLSTALSNPPPSSSLADMKTHAVPSGVGINCTKPFRLKNLVDRWTEHLHKVHIEPPQKPWLWLYPDGGLQYDVVTRTWSSATSTGGVSSPSEPVNWAKGVLEIAKVALESGGWAGVVVGGCCKAGTRHIGALAREARALGASAAR